MAGDKPPGKRVMGVPLPTLEINGRTKEARRSHPGHEVSSNPPPAPLPPPKPPRKPYSPNLTPTQTMFGVGLRDVSEHPPPAPAYRPRAQLPPVERSETDPKSGSVAIAGKGWRVSLPTAAITGLLAVAGTWLTNKATNESSTIREISAEQDREAKRAELDREQRAKQDESNRDRLDKLQTRVSVIEGQNVELDRAIDRLTERLERRRALPPEPQ